MDLNELLKFVTKKEASDLHLKPGRPPLRVPADVRLTQTIKHRDEHGKLLSVEIRAVLVLLC